MRRALAFVAPVAAAAVALAATGCGTSRADAVTVTLRRTAAGLEEVRSARIDLVLTARSAAGRKPVGFSVSGVFGFRQGAPAELDLVYTRLADGVAVRIVSTGGAAYAVRGGVTRKLPAAVAGRLGSAGGSGGESAGGGLGELRVDRWLRSARQVDGEAVGGVPTTRVDASLDARTALGDVARFLGRLGGGGAGGLDEATAERLAGLVRRATVTVWTGEADRLLRRLVIDADLGAAGEDVPAALRTLLPVTARLDVTLTEVNQPVHVVAP